MIHDVEIRIQYIRTHSNMVGLSSTTVSSLFFTYLSAFHLYANKTLWVPFDCLSDEVTLSLCQNHSMLWYRKEMSPPARRERERWREMKSWSREGHIVHWAEFKGLWLQIMMPSVVDGGHTVHDRQHIRYGMPAPPAAAPVHLEWKHLSEGQRSTVG